ncbi:MAG: DUF5060 domain-containing protein [Cyclobacteriaceae bacterium]|nr:DUF5060 domain-containing protein [Cyclobacteriaceae bacterium]
MQARFFYLRFQAFQKHKTTWLYSLGMFAILIGITSCQKPAPPVEIEQWDVFELVLNGPAEGDPYMEVDLTALFMYEGKSLKVPGFYDGEGVYKIRFSPPLQGEWQFETQSNANSLNAKKGKIKAVKPTGNNHGPLQITNTYYLQYADGSPWFGIGTTAYQWTSVKQSIQEKTLQTLSSSPFNKIRMCVFPKHYIYGNETEPWAHPYLRENDESDYTQPNYAYWQNFDLRVSQLNDMGIQADVILFHPYDKDWGYFKMGRDLNERYVRYMIARISAYRNVWWSLANEWDIPEIKVAIDWPGIGNLLQNEDPHQRLRGIHNWYGSEDHFYDHSEKWITHTCTQTSQFYNAIRWRKMYQKPLLFDEMRYEGDVPSGWGNLSGEEMASYFWMAGLSGGYPTHGDTYANDSDGENEVRWWAKGGTLMGTSPPRIAWFRSIMEELPVHEMQPELISSDAPEKLSNNQYYFFKEGEVYLAYVADPKQNLIIELSGNQPYVMDVMDTWSMEIIESREIPAGRLEYTTQIPYTALRITAKK